MLILTRRLKETIIINGNIRITPMGIKGNQIKLAIDAPKDIIINREEIQKRIDSNKNNEIITGNY